MPNKPKFAVGDKVKKIGRNNTHIITGVEFYYDESSPKYNGITGPCKYLYLVFKNGKKSFFEEKDLEHAN
jgi:hypothetical protein